MSTQPRSTLLRAAGLLLLLLFVAGQGAAAAADARSDAGRSSAWVRASGARSLSARDFAAPDHLPAALPLSPVDLVPAGAVVRVLPEGAPRVRAPRSAELRIRLPRGPPVLA